MVRLKHLNTFIEMHETYFHECCPLVQHEFRFCGQSHFSLTTSHCEQAVFSFTMKTLEKQDCSEVKEEESGCCVKGGGEEMEVGVKTGE